MEEVANKEIMNAKEVCKMLNISRTTLHQWTIGGIVPRMKGVKRIFYVREEVLNALKFHSDDLQKNHLKLKEKSTQTYSREEANFFLENILPLILCQFFSKLTGRPIYL